MMNVYEAWYQSLDGLRVLKLRGIMILGFWQQNEAGELRSPLARSHICLA